MLRSSRVRGQRDTVGVIDAFANGFKLFFNAEIQRIAEIKMVRLLAKADDLFGQRFAALAALGPDFGQGNIDAQLMALCFNEIQLGLRVCRKGIDGHDAGQTENILDIADMLQQVGQTLFQGFQILIVQITLRHAAVILQSPDRSDDHNGIRPETGDTALDVEELLRTEIGGETRFRDHIIRQLPASGQGSA